jgi:uncharacterized protein YjbJ (UPF0337 family)
MYTNTVKGDWEQVKGKIKHRFGRLTDDAIESMKGNLDLLSGKLQSTYGYAKDQADREFESFKATIHTAAENFPDTKVKENSKNGTMVNSTPAAELSKNSTNQPKQVN